MKNKDLIIGKILYIAHLSDNNNIEYICSGHDDCIKSIILILLFKIEINIYYNYLNAIF